MKTKTVSLITLAILIYGTATLSFAGEKLMHYFSGSLSRENKKIVQKVKFPDRYGYQLKISFVNYSDSTTTLQYRLNSENYKLVNISALNTKNEKIKINHHYYDNFQIEIEADFPDYVQNYISYDIFILKNE